MKTYSMLLSKLLKLTHTYLKRRFNLQIDRLGIFKVKRWVNDELNMIVQIKRVTANEFNPI